MSTRQARFEVVRRPVRRIDSGSRYYFVRFIASNGKEIFRSSEVYASKRAARRAIAILARTFDADLTAVGVRTFGDRTPPTEVREVHE